jgi:hypothetical protein
LSKWINSAIEESRKNKFVTEFLIKDIMDDIVILYNNFLRMIDPYIEKYPTDFHSSISLDEIKRRLLTNSFNIFQVKKDDSDIIDRIRKNVKEISGNQISNSLLQSMITLVDSIQEFNDINVDSQFSFFEYCEKDKTAFYGLTVSSDLRLEVLENYDEIRGTLHFRKKTFFVTVINLSNDGRGTPSGAFVNVFEKDSLNIVLSDIVECPVEHGVPIMKGCKYYYNIPLYKITDKPALSRLSDLIYNFFDSTDKILNLVKKKPSNKMSGNETPSNLIHFINV